MCADPPPYVYGRSANQSCVEVLRVPYMVQKQSAVPDDGTQKISLWLQLKTLLLLISISFARVVWLGGCEPLRYHHVHLPD